MRQVLPVPASMPEVKGISIGRCIAGPRVYYGHGAHTHCGPTDQYLGWVCSPTKKALFKPSGKPTNTMLHEYAHVLHPKGGHGAGWLKQAKALGVIGLGRYEFTVERNKKVAAHRRNWDKDQRHEPVRQVV